MNRLRRWYAGLRQEAVLRLVNRSGRWSHRARLHLPILMEELPAAPVLTLAPHPDDDVLAVGGSMALHLGAGHRVVSLILTDGSRGDPGGWDPAELATRRREEARAAAEVLGGAEVRFLGGEDSGLNRREAARGIRTVLEELRPATLYLPFPLDYHGDHLVTSAALLEALDGFPDPPRLLSYECVAPMIPSHLVEITPVVETKEAAIRCFATQMESVDYVRTIPRGLNRFRSFALLRGKGYAEALFELEPRLLARLLAALGEPG